MDKQFYVYILTNKSGTLYVGVTNNLIRRSWEHKHNIESRNKTDNPDELNFTARYYIDKLVYYEIFRDSKDAITREKQIKGWSRRKKFSLIKTLNPTFKDLYPKIVV